MKYTEGSQDAIALLEVLEEETILDISLFFDVFKENLNISTDVYNFDKKVEINK